MNDGCNGPFLPSAALQREQEVTDGCNGPFFPSATLQREQGVTGAVMDYSYLQLPLKGNTVSKERQQSAGQGKETKERKPCAGQEQEVNGGVLNHSYFSYPSKESTVVLQVRETWKACIIQVSLLIR